MSEQLAHPELPEDPIEGLTGLATVFCDMKWQDEVEDDIAQATRLYARHRQRDFDLTLYFSQFRASDVASLRQRIADMKARLEEIKAIMHSAGFRQH